MSLESGVGHVNSPNVEIVLGKLHSAWPARQLAGDFVTTHDAVIMGDISMLTHHSPSEAKFAVDWWTTSMLRACLVSPTARGGPGGLRQGTTVRSMGDRGW